ncbi:DNA-binding transcriptional LysR family regulator [Rhodoferax ferrireducens]|uniref:DNA-binding transcriptional LysR family regulator n=1 Tax=Rhodoferax ferrireducens TaxID=192843 RepID=A0ABU2C8R5_9BURK|nr:LysR substrate-binding domain-containing protein [Rhodoferax ferrireducens]MDR7377714.1 DNA-binding transcriptional LysR family regulator [Rhodoferax ferrireducens]
MGQVTYDIDMLRSFSTGIALGSYARAADRLGRSTSAVSAQLKKLESQSGTPLLRKSGRGLELTDAGETLLAYAHRLLALNDEAVAAVRGTDLQGRVRLGLQEDLGEAVLPEALGRFARAHPKVRIEACVATSAVLRERLALGQLDLAMFWDVGLDAADQHTDSVLRLPLQWIGPADLDALDAPWWQQLQKVGRGAQGDLQEPIPLVVVDAPCPLREIVTTTLERAGLPWRYVFTSSSLAALWAATSAGLGLCVRTPFGLPAHVRTIERTGTVLPALPQITLALRRASSEPEPPVQRLAELLTESVQQNVRVRVP